MNTRSLLLFCTGLFLVPPLPARAQTDWDSVPIRVTPLRGGVHMLSAAGGNLAVFLGPDGTLVVDSDYAQLTERILATIGDLPAKMGGAEGAAGPPVAGGRIDPTIRFLANTHWHFDHTGGNENFARAGAIIVAHEAVARLMAEDQVLTALGGREVPAAGKVALPVITFNDRLNLAWNGDLIHLVHMPLAHSDGDVIVHFRDADVVHMGDLFFNGMYPYIDVDFGGNLAGMVRATKEVLDHSNETTLFIPGHGSLATRSDLLAYHEMLRTTLERIQPLVEAGRTREEVIAAKPTADLDAAWVREPGSEEADFFVGLVYDGMVKGGQGG